MMVSPISNVRFTAATEAPAAPNPLERKGAFAKPDAPADKVEIKEKKGGHAVRNTVVGLFVAAAALVALHKTNVLKVLPAADLADAGIMKKAGHYLAKAGEFIGKYTYEPVANLVKKILPSKAAGTTTV